jgi:hypothetical protein
MVLPERPHTDDAAFDFWISHETLKVAEDFGAFTEDNEGNEAPLVFRYLTLKPGYAWKLDLMQQIGRFITFVSFCKKSGLLT